MDLHINPFIGYHIIKKSIKLIYIFLQILKIYKPKSMVVAELFQKNIY
ncbi:MAG: hypothetical protein ACI97N_002253 [Cognaticolwellia sp.]|jgi:hypothetical protein